MRRFAFLMACVVGLAPPLSLANASAWTVDRDKSSVSFEYVESGKSKIGAFDMFTASIAFDPKMPENASASFSVDTRSIDLNDAMREGVLKTVPWFDSSRFPKADFRLTELEPVEGNRFLAIGALRIKEIELPVQLTFSLSVEGEIARASGALEIDRKDFRLRDAVLESIVGIGETVKIGFDLVATLD